MLAGATNCLVTTTTPSPTNIQTVAEGGPSQTTQPTEPTTTGNTNNGEDQPNVAIIVGIVITVILITVLFTVAIILVMCLVQRRNCYSTKEDGLVNPSYDLSESIVN